MGTQILNILPFLMVKKDLLLDLLLYIVEVNKKGSTVPARVKCNTVQKCAHLAQMCILFKTMQPTIFF